MITNPAKSMPLEMNKVPAVAKGAAKLPVGGRHTHAHTHTHAVSKRNEDRTGCPPATRCRHRCVTPVYACVHAHARLCACACVLLCTRLCPCVCELVCLCVARTPVRECVPSQSWRAPVDVPSEAPVHASRRAQPPRVVLDGMPAHVQPPRDWPHACAKDLNHKLHWRSGRWGRG